MVELALVLSLLHILSVVHLHLLPILAAFPVFPVLAVLAALAAHSVTVLQLQMAEILPGGLLLVVHLKREFLLLDHKVLEQ